MKKFITGALGWFFISLVALGLAALVLWTRLPDYLSNSLSKTLGVAVEIRDIEISYDSITIDNLEIDNIKGGILPRAFSAETISIQTPITQYTHQPIQIDKILINNVYLGLEFDSATSTKGNWTRILSHAQGDNVKEEKKKKRKSQEPTAPKNEGKTIFIKVVEINNISTDLVYVKGDGKIKKLPVISQITLKNINTAEGFPVEQLTNSILGQMLTQVFIQQNLKNMLDAVVPKIQELNEWIGPFKGIFNP